MKLYLALTLAAGLITMSSCGSKRMNNDPKKEQPGMDAARNLLIYYDQDTGNAALLKTVQAYGAEVVYLYDALNGIAIGIPDDKDIEEAIEYFTKVPGVSSVERDGMMSIQKQMKK